MIVVVGSNFKNPDSLLSRLNFIVSGGDPRSDNKVTFKIWPTCLIIYRYDIFFTSDLSQTSFQSCKN